MMLFFERTRPIHQLSDGVFSLQDIHQNARDFWSKLNYRL